MMLSTACYQKPRKYRQLLLTFISPMDIVDNKLQQEVMMGDEIDLFRSFISRKGLRNTPEREEIIAEIFSTKLEEDLDKKLP